MERKFKIIKVNKGIANRFPNSVIEIHGKLYLPEYSELLLEIIAHEKEHTDSWTVKDIALDIVGFRHKIKYAKFILTTPSSWWQFIPIYKAQDGQYYYDITLMLFYGLTAALIGIGGLL